MKILGDTRLIGFAMPKLPDLEITIAQIVQETRAIQDAHTRQEIAKVLEKMPLYQMNTTTLLVPRNMTVVPTDELNSLIKELKEAQP